MKKLLLLFLILTAFSCSKDEEDKEPELIYCITCNINYIKGVFHEHIFQTNLLCGHCGMLFNGNDDPTAYYDHQEECREKYNGYSWAFHGLYNE